VTLWKSDIDRLLPGSILQWVKYHDGEVAEECDKLRLVKIMTQTQNWACTEEEAVERIKKSSEENPFTIGDESFWYEA
jgi:hypothetical protein